MKTLNSTRTIWLLIVALAAIALTACSGVVTPAPEEAAPAAADAPADTADAAATSAPAEEATSADAAPTLSGDRPLAAFEPVDRNNNYFSEPPEMTIDPSKYYYATIKTEKGDIKVQLFADRAPQTVNNFVFLAEQGFYDDTTFHRSDRRLHGPGRRPDGHRRGRPRLSPTSSPRRQL
ncbi:MAG: peptidylprolyl isomerase [Caldilineaceae bacterium]